MISYEFNDTLLYAATLASCRDRRRFDRSFDRDRVRPVRSLAAQSQAFQGSGLRASPAMRVRTTFSPKHNQKKRHHQHEFNQPRYTSQGPYCSGPHE
jgi:hypothetical protein